MLILSRRVGESIIVDGTIKATVAVIGADFVDLGLSEVGGARLRCVTLDTRELRPVIDGVTGIMIKKIEAGRVRLGFEVRRGVSIGRPDVVG